MAKFVARKDAAAALGITRQRLEHLIRQGVIPETEQGIDLDRARRLRKVNTDPARRAAYLESRQRATGAQQPASAPAPVPEMAAATPAETQPAPPPAPPKRTYARRGADTVAPDAASSTPEPGETGDLFDFSKARTAKEVWNARIAEQKYREQSGLLVSRSDIEAREFAIARKLRDRLLGFPARIANYVPAGAMKIISDEIDALIRELADDAARITREK